VDRIYHADLLKGNGFFPESSVDSVDVLGTATHAVILAAQEAEIRKIAVRSPPGRIVCETLFR
jgi:hypothetical protein